jgi:hypothetical protein
MSLVTSFPPSAAWIVTISPHFSEVARVQLSLLTWNYLEMYSVTLCPWDNPTHVDSVHHQSIDTDWGERETDRAKERLNTGVLKTLFGKHYVKVIQPTVNVHENLCLKTLLGKGIRLK